MIDDLSILDDVSLPDVREASLNLNCPIPPVPISIPISCHEHGHGVFGTSGDCRRAGEGVRPSQNHTPPLPQNLEP